MKFEHKYPDAQKTDRYEFEYSFVTKSIRLGECRCCGSLTKWFDILFQINVCSEECCSELWNKYKNDLNTKSKYENFDNHFNTIKNEINLLKNYKEIKKDIIIIVKDQLEYFKECIESIERYTQEYNLFIWDNDSEHETKKYLDLIKSPSVAVKHSEKNIGFILSNNQLISNCSSPYVILLNSDTKVFENWDKLMITFLENNKDFAQVGYWGGHLDQDGRGFGGANGEEIDYVPGWCFCIGRDTYQEFGLFDENLKFAYFEDSDFSLRLKKAGKRIYSLYSPLVYHHQNKTVKTVEKEGDIDLRKTFDHNHAYFKNKWSDYLSKERVVISKQYANGQS